MVYKTGLPVVLGSLKDDPQPRMLGNICICLGLLSNQTELAVVLMELYTLVHRP